MKSLFFHFGFPIFPATKNRQFPSIWGSMRTTIWIVIYLILILTVMWTTHLVYVWLVCKFVTFRVFSKFWIWLILAPSSWEEHSNVFTFLFKLHIRFFIPKQPHLSNKTNFSIIFAFFYLFFFLFSNKASKIISNREFSQYAQKKPQNSLHIVSPPYYFPHMFSHSHFSPMWSSRIWLYPGLSYSWRWLLYLYTWWYYLFRAKPCPPRLWC